MTTTLTSDKDMRDRRTVRVSLPMLVLALAVSSPAGAANDPEGGLLGTLTQLGFRGEWSPDCYRAASPQNLRLVVNVNSFGITFDTHHISGPMAAEIMVVNTVTPIPPDLIRIELSSVTLNKDIYYDRVDTYQTVGSRLRLFASRITSASPDAVAAGWLPGETVAAGVTTREANGFVGVFTPKLERCRE